MSAGQSGASTESRTSVSVVIPCYQARATLSRAVGSVAAQTLLPLEVIIVDDGSSDGSAEEVARLKAEFGQDWIRLKRLERNSGVSAARNAGWDMAQGEMVAFLDADDAWHPQKLELQCRVMRNTPDLALTGHRFVLAGHPVQRIEKIPDVGFVSAQALLWRNRFVTPSVMLRRNIRARFAPTQRHMEDHLLWMEIAFAGHRIGLIDAPLAILFKPAFVHSGLSANLRAMEAAELSNYRHLRRAGHISATLCAALQAWSLLKYVRRIVLATRYAIRKPEDTV